MAGSGKAKANTIRMTGFEVTVFGIGVTVIFFFLGSSLSLGGEYSMADVTAESIASYGDSLSSVLKSSAFVTWMIIAVTPGVHDREIKERRPEMRYEAS